MACFHPLTAWRTPQGEIQISKNLKADSIPLRLPCGGCLGCRKAYSQAWALRCQLELQQHNTAVFTTLTYDDDHLPLTLQKQALPLWIRALRKHKGTKSLRFFACGEYGERTQRPHYHAILFGASLADAQLIEQKWPHGHTRTENATPDRVAYTAGYCQKKIGYRRHAHERTDPLTGEVYEWQPPFKLMSRRPGIGNKARDAHPASWKSYAIKDGHKMAVPRYLHEAWKKTATAEQLETLAYEKSLLKNIDDAYTLNAREKIEIRKQEIQANERKY